MLALLLAGLFWISDTQFCYTQVSQGVYTNCVNKIGEQVYQDEYVTFTIPVWSDGKISWAGNPYAQEQQVIGVVPEAQGIGAAWLNGYGPVPPSDVHLEVR